MARRQLGKKGQQSGRQVRMHEFLVGPLPKLIAGPFHTTSSAIHDILYKGPLPKWTAFSEDVERHLEEF
jgi:hypothetical protein